MPASGTTMRAQVGVERAAEPLVDLAGRLDRQHQDRHVEQRAVAAGSATARSSVDWLQPLAAPTIIVACGPRRMSAAMSTMYDTDMFEPLAIGNWTLKADVSDDSRTKKSEREDRRERGAGHERARRSTAPSDDDPDDVPAGARRQIPEQDASVYTGGRGAGLTAVKHLFYTVFDMKRMSERCSSAPRRSVGAGAGAYVYLNRRPTALVLTGIVTTNDVIVSPQIGGQIGQLLVDRRRRGQEGPAASR